MKIGILILIMSVLGLCASFVTDSPEDTVIAFFDAGLKGDLKEAGKFVINEPADIHEKAYGPKNPVSLAADDSSIPKYRPGPPTALSTEDLVNSLIPDFFMPQSRTLTKIIKVKKNATEARVRAGFGNSKFADVVYDFLLVKKDGKWLIFKSLAFDPYHESDSYDFFASPDSDQE